MRIGGLQKFSLIDYPDKVCCVVFTQGCNFRCGFCHNPELVQPEKFIPPLSEQEAFSFLKSRRGKLDGVVITGGEPTVQPDLLRFIDKVKKSNFKVKLDTNGSKPEVLKKALGERLLDYIAMDIKGPLERYPEITNSLIDTSKIKQSMALIMSSGLPYEFRTTVVNGQLKQDDFVEIGRLIKGARLYVLQKFVVSKANDPAFLQRKSPSDEELKQFQNLISPYVSKCLIR